MFRTRRLLLAALVLPLSLGNASAQGTEVKIAVGLAKPPYILGPGKTGLEYEIVQKALEAGGYRMHAEAYPPSRALALLRAGHLDGMVTVTEGIGPLGYFSDDYITYQNVAITLKKRNIRLQGVQDLARYSVAAFQNASLILTPDYAAAVQHHPHYTEYPQQIMQNKLLFAGRVDVVVGDRLVFRHLARQLGTQIDSSQPVTVHEIFPPTPRKAVFRDESVRDAFNSGLRIIRQNGTYAAIQARYRNHD
jgi:polar amino acid transport system substrate-binding protein